MWILGLKRLNDESSLFFLYQCVPYSPASVAVLNDLRGLLPRNAITGMRGRGHCTAFFDKTLYFQSASPHSGL